MTQPYPGAQAWRSMLESYPTHQVGYLPGGASPAFYEASPPAPAGYLYQPAVSQVGDLYPGRVALRHDLPAQAYERYDFPNPGPLNGEMIYPGRGLPPRRGEDRPGLSPWGRLARGQPLGKRTVLVYDAEAAARPQPSTVTILKLEGDDMDAQPVCVTIAPPLVIPLPFTRSLFTGGTQNLTGEQSNLENTGNFPGLTHPTVWPPFHVIVEWGVGGSSSRMSVDVINGAVVPNLSASWIRVHAVVPAGTAVTGTSAAYVVSAFVGPGPAVGSASNTVWVGPLDAGVESDATPVPRFGHRVYVAGTNVPAGLPVLTAATLRLWQDRARTQPVANYMFNGAQPLPFEIPNGAMFASVVNDMAVAARFGIVYSLSGGV